MSQRIVVIGGNAAGMSASQAARRIDGKAEIELIEAEPYPAYSRCGLPFVVGGEIPSFESLVVHPPRHYEMMNIHLRTNTYVRDIDEKAKTLGIESHDKKEELIHYDKLVLATGADATIPPIKGREKEGVFKLRTIGDGEKITREIQNAKSAVVIGAGLIGLESTDAFVKRGLRTTVVEIMPHVLPTMLDADMAAYVQERLRENGVNTITGKGVEEIIGGDHVTEITIGKDTIETNIVLAATGVRAHTELASQAGAELGPTRAIRVDPQMRTTAEDIYAAGDCVECTNLITGQPALSQLGTNAVKQGYIAGTNAAGGSASFPGILGSAVSKLFDLEVGATGLTESQAENAGIRTVSASVASRTRAEYFPGGKRIRIKIVADGQGRVLGCQTIGGENVAQRINMVAVAIQNRVTVWDLAKTDTCYSPPVGIAIDPVCITADVVAAKLRR